MSIWDQIRKSVGADTSAAANAVKNAQGNSTPTVDTSYGANTPSAPVVGATVGAGVANAANAVAGAVNGAYNGMTYGDYIAGSQSAPQTLVHNPNDGSAAKPTTLEYQVGRDEPKAETLPYNPNSGSAQKTPLSAPASGGGSSTPPAAETAPDAPVTSAWDGVAAIDSYEEYLRKQEGAYKDIYDEQTQYYNDQNQKTLEAIEAQRQAALDEAQNQKDLLYGAAETAKNSAYSNAEQQLMADLNYSQQQYDTLIESINAQKNSGMALAEEQKQALLSMSEEQRNAVYAYAEEKRAADIAQAEKQYGALIEAINAQKLSGEALAQEQRDLLLSMSKSQRSTIYAAAKEQYNADILHATKQYKSVIDAINQQKATGEAMAAEQRDLLLSMSKEMQEKVYEAAELQRQQAYTSADVERKRSVVDARSSYEQNKASYGAKAEAMAGMGLTGSGYSDYINQQAYAQQRAETQQANAQAAAVKRDADYVEGQAKLQADTDYLQNKHTAESQYADRMYDLDLSYQKNKLSADQVLEDSKHSADSARRQTATNAEAAHQENVYNAQSQYSQNMYEIDTTYQGNKTAADQALAEGKHAAESAERSAKAQADADHLQNQYNAESQYKQNMYEVDTTYATNKANADAQKSAMDYEAHTNERNAKHEADQAYNENKYAADSSYSKNVADAEAAARADTLTANQAADAGKFNADMSYRENMLNNDNAIGAYRQQKADEAAAKAEEETSYARAVYTEFLAGANSGSYTADQLRQLAQEYGLSEEQTNSLVNAANDYEQKRQAAANAELSAGTGDNIGYIEDAVQSGAITEEQGKAQIENIQESNYNSFAEDISYGYADTDAIDKAYADGKISQAQYDDLKAKWNNSIDTSASTFYNNDGTALLNKSAAKVELDKICNSKWCSAATKNALRAVYDSLYTPITKSVSFNNDGSFLFFGSDDLAEAGNNFSVIKGDTKYRIQSGGEITDTNIKEVASSLSDGTVFGYQGTIYIKKDNRVFKIEKRSNSYTDHYNNLYNVFFGGRDTTSVAAANSAGENMKQLTGDPSTSTGTSQISGFRLPYRATSSETAAAHQAIQNNDYETFKRYMPSSYTEQQKRAYYERYGGK